MDLSDENGNGLLHLACQAILARDNRFRVANTLFLE